MRDLAGMRIYIENNWLVVRDGTGQLVWSYPLPNIDGLLLVDIVNDCAAIREAEKKPIGASSEG